MKQGTIYGTTDNPKIDCKIEWTAKPVYAENASEITASLYFKRNDSGPYVTNGSGFFEISIDGLMSGMRATLHITNTAWAIAAEATRKIPHDSSGEKNVTFSAKGGFPGMETISCFGEANLDTIPVSADLKEVSDTELLQAPKLKFENRSGTAFCKVIYQMGNFFMQSPIFQPAKTGAVSYAGDILPLSAAAEIPNGRTGKMTVTLTTYLDREGTVQTGQPSQKEITVTIPDVPEMYPKGKMQFTPVHHRADSRFQNVFIQRESELQVHFHDVVGAYGATVECKMTVMGKTYGAPFLSEKLTAFGTHTVRGNLTDSRGFTAEITGEIQVQAYTDPEILPYPGDEKITAFRCNSDGIPMDDGTYVKIHGKKRYSPIWYQGENLNTCTMRYRHKETDDTAFSPWETLPVLSEENDTFVSSPLPSVAPENTKTYLVELELRDMVGGVRIATLQVLTNSVTFHLGRGGKKAAFGKLAEKENCLDVGWDLAVRGALHPAHICEIGTFDGMDPDLLKEKTGYYTGIEKPSEKYPVQEKGILFVLAAKGYCVQLYMAKEGAFYRFYTVETGFTAWKQVVMQNMT